MWHLTQFRYSNGDLLTLYRESITSSVFCCAKSTFSKEKAKITSSVFCYAKSTFSREKAKITSSVFCCAKSTFSKEKAKVRRWKVEIRVRRLKKS